MADSSAPERPAWLPAVEGSPPLLRPTPMVANTLSGTKVEFRPREGNTIRWYICGPTVYDSSHLGHARTYVAFDMIRRILESFFGYDIFCVMNVTDVDDKIILRARRNHLLAEYRAASPALAQVVSDGKEELVNAQASYHAKVAKLEAGLAAETRSGMRQGIQEELDTAHYKHRLVVGYEKALQEAEAGAGGDVDALLGKVGDLIAARLDDAKGAEVRDQGIFRAHAAHYEKEYLEDMKLLGVRVPDVLTRVTEFMPQIVKYIEKIIENGFAYEAQGSVYFDIREFSKTHGYRKLSWNAASVLAAMAEGEGALASNEGKKSEMDFALWKKSKGGEPSWESPWGGGRPGWHIECSVMASELLGDVLDVHGGGIDLCFPHHDNELAQAEAYYGHQQWVNYFLHSGHLYIGYQKMSKSLKNFFTIREVLKGGSEMKISEEESVTLPPYSARQMRLLFMMHQWDQPMYFSKDTLDVAVGKEKTFKDFFGMVKALARDDLESVANKVQAWGPDDVALNKRVEETQIAITAALTDNFNTPMALLKMQELVSAVNVYITAAGPDAKFLLINKAACYIGKIFKTLGIDDDCSAFPFVTSQGGGDDEEVLGATLDALCAFRDEVRKGARGKETPEWFTAKAAECRAGTLADLDAKVAGKVSALPQVLGAMRQWVDSVSAAAEAKEGAVMYLKLCDKVRDDVLPALGVRLEDRTDGSFLWKLDDAEVLLRERAEQIQVASEAAKKKVENKLAMKVKDLDKWKSSTQTPAEMFKAMADKYSKFDDAGVPTHTAAGEELSKKQRQTAEKDFKKKEAEYTKQQEQLAATPGLVAGIEKEIEDLRKLMAEL